MMKIIFGCVLAIFTSVSHAATWNVLGGTMEAIAPDGSSPGGLVAFSGNGAFAEGVFTGSAGAIATDSSATYVGMDVFSYLGADFFSYFAPSGKDGEVNRLTGLSAPSIDLGTMTADMTSMFANWNSHVDPYTGEYYVGEYNIGGIAEVTDLGLGAYELAWGSIQTSGPFTGVTVNMTMQVSAVPVPAAVWLFGSGLVGLAGFAHKRS